MAVISEQSWSYQHISPSHTAHITHSTQYLYTRGGDRLWVTSHLNNSVIRRVKRDPCFAHQYVIMKFTLGLSLRIASYGCSHVKRPHQRTACRSKCHHLGRECHRKCWMDWNLLGLKGEEGWGKPHPSSPFIHPRLSKLFTYPNTSAQPPDQRGSDNRGCIVHTPHITHSTHHTPTNHTLHTSHTTHIAYSTHHTLNTVYTRQIDRLWATRHLNNSVIKWVIRTAIHTSLTNMLLPSLHLGFSENPFIRTWPCEKSFSQNIL